MFRVLRGSPIRQVELTQQQVAVQLDRCPMPRRGRARRSPRRSRPVHDGQQAPQPEQGHLQSAGQGRAVILPPAPSRASSLPNRSSAGTVRPPAASAPRRGDEASRAAIQSRLRWGRPAPVSRSASTAAADSRPAMSHSVWAASAGGLIAGTGGAGLARGTAVSSHRSGVSGRAFGPTGQAEFGRGQHGDGDEHLLRGQAAVVAVLLAHSGFARPGGDRAGALRQQRTRALDGSSPRQAVRHRPASAPRLRRPNCSVW